MKKDPYEDLLALPHHRSSVHPPLSMEQRAAQFSPFAALTGYEEAIREEGRLTREALSLSEGEKELLDRKQALLLHRLQEEPEVTATVFVPDDRKAGGAYVRITGRLLRADPVRRVLLFTDRRELPLDNIVALDSPLFPEEWG